MTMDKQTIDALASIFGLDGTEIKVGFGDYRKPSDMADWYGIPGVKYVSSRNNWSDAQLYYKKCLFNVHDAEDAMWERYGEECSDDFEAFMRDHADEVYELLDDLVIPEEV